MSQLGARVVERPPGRVGEQVDGLGAAAGSGVRCIAWPTPTMTGVRGSIGMSGAL